VTRILIVDDHVVVREGVRRLVAALPGAEIVEAANAREALTEYRKAAPDVVVLDINLEGGSGLELLGRLLAHWKDARIVMFSMHAERDYVMRALRAGAKGYVSKSAPADELIEALKRVRAGETYIDRELATEMQACADDGEDPTRRLSNREVEMLRLLGEGKSIAEMASTFGVAYKTIANSCSALKTKLGLERTADLLRYALERRDR
jgi:DNA-binding NarL/FixJ family response regulator